MRCIVTRSPRYPVAPSIRLQKIITKGVKHVRTGSSNIEYRIQSQSSCHPFHRNSVHIWPVVAIPGHPQRHALLKSLLLRLERLFHAVLLVPSRGKAGCRRGQGLLESVAFGDRHRDPRISAMATAHTNVIIRVCGGWAGTCSTTYLSIVLYQIEHSVW
jgi:hypothetical protein